jgi:hypothetical protein
MSQNTMRDVSLRWGIGMGAVAAGIGVLARLVGLVLAPIPAYTTAETVVVSLAIQGFLVLGSIGAALVLANYAGQRVERDHMALLALAAEEGQDAEPQAREDRSGSLLAGLYVMLCFWFISQLYNALGPPTQQGAGRQPLNIPVLLISGVIYALLGAGCGGLGGRAVAARQLMRGVVKPARTISSANGAVSPTATPPPASLPRAGADSAAGPAAGPASEPAAAEPPAEATGATGATEGAGAPGEPPGGDEGG